MYLQSVVSCQSIYNHVVIYVLCTDPQVAIVNRHVAFWTRSTTYLIAHTKQFYSIIRKLSLYRNRRLRMLSHVQGNYFNQRVRVHNANMRNIYAFAMRYTIIVIYEKCYKAQSQQALFQQNDRQYYHMDIILNK